jgi:hypothetical protein
LDSYRQLVPFEIGWFACLACPLDVGLQQDTAHWLRALLTPGVLLLEGLLGRSWVRDWLSEDTLVPTLDVSVTTSGALISLGKPSVVIIESTFSWYAMNSRGAESPSPKKLRSA